ncbi:exodeoxyribonuclease VII large subunit [bacterium (Candidatus Blackallbacteria) CG17_big_fil_post_rev_8_21_14_2_50_48_46]|uniref:Exodeoxyribonuclease 7 large subunit n=1 Tax=bacterium (Candidatus Blackallbacteria) CG17_big_fil_post_rev_8_21_14_2_50_48_46 TaxID=2014261 RepID=A0A2M7G2W5_9BACT|nr:MAG: exodeoxyribonuclease VII large subunit [bacterium (Candidatus Blackallbacteria) CG18_big_fil_WC_8_21_14_2_50_49_26]PIW16159.1 MAG: exodeoxyribonuclease VII large subunit [bacterium (Candidatus Blackallbacteria) CG17_big_fil_post_rev_8_21_14_2_50_48_46]PIW44246.1 MAG: exodeoxyribonuclease VII large subunit [bacterium (Candidatus Blackallbacteria) CG13_big_fil_rev_8_21_14_2_50_49_14]
MSSQPVSVTTLTRAIKEALEASFPYPVRVEGEVSNFRPHYSGHAYFTLKDSFAQLAAVMWKSRAINLPFALEDGLQVVCTGTVTLYEKTGRYQFNVLEMHKAGKGDLQARFEALKRELWEAGLFDEAHKLPLPTYPGRVGVITSPTGAALRDILSVARRRNPTIPLLLRPAQVQGEGAAADLAQAIRDLNRHGGVDVILLGRGGGSLEDLWAFNEEELARAIFASRIPIVSAVGHEIDFTIADFVADSRAATPSAAAELLIPNREEMLGQLYYYQDKLATQLLRRVQIQRHRLESLKQHYILRKPELLLSPHQEALKRQQTLLAQAYTHQLQAKRQALELLKSRLQGLDPRQVLERGFVMVEQQNQPITRAEALKSGPVRLIFAQGVRTGQLALNEEN